MLSNIYMVANAMVANVTATYMVVRASLRYFPFDRRLAFEMDGL